MCAHAYTSWSWYVPYSSRCEFLCHIHHTVAGETRVLHCDTAGKTFEGERGVEGWNRERRREGKKGEGREEMNALNSSQKTFPDHVFLTTLVADFSQAMHLSNTLTHTASWLAEVTLTTASRHLTSLGVGRAGREGRGGGGGRTTPPPRRPR